MVRFLFNNHQSHMERLQELGIKSLPDFDTFLSEQKYMSCVLQMISAIYMLRNMLVDLWSEAVFLEEARVNGIQSLYEELVQSNQSLYGQEVMKQLLSLKNNQNKTELYLPLSLMDDKTIQAFNALCIDLGKKCDLARNNILEVQHVLESMKIEDAPRSNLIEMQDVLMRDPGVFSSWTDCLVILTKDSFMHIYELDKKQP